MTFVEVTDSAVKIGLGALLSGIFAWLAMRNQQRHDVARERLRRRFDAIEAIADQFHAASRTYVEAGNVALAVLHGVGEGDALLKALDEIPTAGDELSRIDGRLRLLGLTTIADQIAEYQNIADDMRGSTLDVIHEKRAFAEQDFAGFKKLAGNLRVKRDTIYRLLADAYSTVV